MPNFPKLSIGRPMNPNMRSASTSKSFASTEELNQVDRTQDPSRATTVQPHLMPFTISYNGPAPVGSFMVLSDPGVGNTFHIEDDLEASKPASDADESHTTANATLEELKCYESAFRGRGIHGTPLPLPQGWTGVILEVPSAGSTASAAAPSSSTAAREAATAAKTPASVPHPAPSAAPPSAASLLRRSPRKSAGRPGSSTPASAALSAPRAKRFKMDSDSDDSDDFDAAPSGATPHTRAEKTPDSALVSEAEKPGIQSVDDIDLEADWIQASPESAARPLGDQMDQSPDETKSASATGRVMPIVGTFDHLYVWSPDGPVDKGDDVYIRTLHEWQNHVVNVIHQQ